MQNLHGDSIADKVFALLEEAILSGCYPRGNMLTELWLSAEYGVSRTPIREALRRLEQEHLVREHGKGIEVIGISEEDIFDIYDVRMHLEPYAASSLAEHFQENGVERISQILDRQEYYIVHGNTEEIRNTDSEFHGFIYKNCSNPTLGEILGMLHKKIQLYRKTSLGDPERAAAALGEHQKIYVAVSAGDAASAEARMREHLENARVRMLKK